MATMQERYENAATILTSVGELNHDATPAQRLAAADALTDAQILARSERLLNALGCDGYHHPAAA